MVTFIKWISGQQLYDYWFYLDAYADSSDRWKLGFKKVPKSEIKNGTIAVWSGSDSHPHGHICVKYGEFWYSDFKQKNVMCWITGAGDSKVEYFNIVE